MLVLFFVMLIAGWQSGLRGAFLIGYDAYLCGFVVVIGLVRAVMARHTRTNWDISDHKKRLLPLLVLMVIFGVNLIVVNSLFQNAGLLNIHILWFIWIIGFYLLTLKTKISGHISVLTLANGLIVWWFGPTLLPVLVSIPLVAWSRLVLKRHTIIEVVGGFLYSLAFLVLIR